MIEKLKNWKFLMFNEKCFFFFFCKILKKWKFLIFFAKGKKKLNYGG